VKRSKMDRGAIKELMYGGVAELMRNRKYFYHSSVGAQYCHFTEEGERAIVEYMNLVSWKMVEAESKELDNRAKSIVLTTLKGESTTSE